MNYLITSDTDVACKHLLYVGVHELCYLLQSYYCDTKYVADYQILMEW